MHTHDKDAVSLCLFDIMKLEPSSDKTYFLEFKTITKLVNRRVRTLQRNPRLHLSMETKTSGLEFSTHHSNASKCIKLPVNSINPQVAVAGLQFKPENSILFLQLT
ncbi:hypothetical protein AMECASPLE_034953 [Ameca splendens]|uniref:Uncharacterized protein n=1 Tax=Ameca splendens TaxID=208324 RepID=A0ABV0XW28_9TELE